VIAVFAWGVDVAFEHHGLHVVVEQAPGHATERLKGMLVAVDQGTDFQVGDEFDVTRPAVSKGRAEGIQRISAFAKLDPVDLQLFAWRGLETNDRISSDLRSNRAQEDPQLADTAGVAQGANLPEQNRRRNPLRLRCSLSVAQVRFMGRELGGLLLLALVARLAALRQVAAHGIHRAAHFGCNLAQTQSMLPQYFDFHIHLLRDHRRLYQKKPSPIFDEWQFGVSTFNRCAVSIYFRC
jgi:hypothetical protein